MQGDIRPNPEVGWQFKQSDSAPAANEPIQSTPAPAVKPQQQIEPLSPIDPITWRAVEFIDHDKGVKWYASLTGVAVVATALIYIATHGDKISSIMIIVAAIFFGVYAARKPRTLNYQLDESGLKAGERSYGYDQFRSFAVVDEPLMHNITLLPLKRFSLAVTLYVAPEDEEDIVDVLSEFLPMENHDGDMVDRFLHYIRF